MLCMSKQALRGDDLTMSDRLEKLLDIAEDSVRLRGYHAVSFRELADALGIKSSSVHYYFRQKEDLGLALVKRYEDRFFAAVETATADSTTPTERIAAFMSVYRLALNSSSSLCLCGMLGAESAGLPTALAAAVAQFFKRNTAWLEAAMPEDLSADARERKARHALAALQGAMMIAISLGDHAVFENTVQDLQSTLTT